MAKVLVIDDEPEVRVLLDERAGLIAIEARHHDVDEDHLWSVVADFRERVEAVFSEDHVVSRLAQEKLCAATNGVAVVDDEDLDRAGRRAAQTALSSKDSRNKGGASVGCSCQATAACRPSPSVLRKTLTV